ncbi:MAG: sugar phosphate isomerase/epimerase [Lachnospiraceae bacterium]|nr:sugar phosphate isomerase/epimerase [Lachnospiraceae bacterium]
MYLSICTGVYGDFSFAETLDKVKAHGLDYVEVCVGGWGPNPHGLASELIKDDAKLEEFKNELAKRDMHISALNCSGNPLCPGEIGKKHSDTAYDTVTLAGKLGVKTVVMMSGLPAACPTDQTPNWITSTQSLPCDKPYLIEAYRYQWEDVAIPWWKEFVKHCDANGVRIAIEEFPGQLVYNVSTFKKLRAAVGETVGINLDPSHLMAFGADPIASARALKGMIYYVHGKDARIERGLSDIDGIIDNSCVEDIETRTWNYVAVGCGHDLKWWKEFFSVLSMGGYKGVVALEMEDLTMSVEAGVTTSIEALEATISK